MARATKPDVDDVADDLDHRAGEFLQVLRDADGRVSTTEIREETNMTNSQVRYRREKLEDLGLISVREPRSSSPPAPPKEHALTDRGESLLRRGLCDRFAPPEPGSFDELVALVDGLRERMNSLEERLETVERRSERTRDYVGAGAPISNDEPLADRLDELEETLADVDERLEGKRDKRGGVL